MTRWKIPIVLTVALAAIGYLLVTGVSRNDLYMSSLEDWQPERAKRERVRVMGWIAEGSISEHSELLVTDFVMRNQDGTVRQAMVYEGVVPDLFTDGSNLIAAGRLGSDGIFLADDLMTKCPSKYEGAEEHPSDIPLPGPTTQAPVVPVVPVVPEAAATYPPQTAEANAEPGSAAQGSGL
jgi:cytochrome c-type biogenesis protein CcmE